jgi:hypothetical protein
VRWIFNSDSPSVNRMKQKKGILVQPARKIRISENDVRRSGRCSPASQSLPGSNQAAHDAGGRT